jgi:hypothetical protein
MMAYSVPMDLIQQAGGLGLPGPGSGIVQAGGMNPVGPPGLPEQPLAPGMGVPPGVVAGVGALTSPLGAGGHGNGGMPVQAQRTEVAFVGPQGMQISWYTPGGFAGALTAPARYNFLQGAIYRLKLSRLPNRPGMELYPTLEVVPANAKTVAFLAHSAVPVAFTNEDLDQVAAGNFLIKVIYLPDPAFQDIAATGPDEIVSTRLEPGVDPIAEAARRGSVLMVVRVGNINLELPNTPAMNAPSMYAPQGVPPVMPGHGMLPGMLPGMPGMPGMPAGMMADPSGPGSRPYGPIIQPGMIPVPSSPAAGTSPVSQNAPAAPTSNYAPSNPTSAQLAGQTGDTGSSTDNAFATRKASGGARWWQGSGDKN